MICSGSQSSVASEFQEDIALTVTQSYLDECFRDCEGVGGLQVDVVSGSVGVGGIESKSVRTVGVGGLVEDLVGVGGFLGKIP